MSEAQNDTNIPNADPNELDFTTANLQVVASLLTS
jgi:hypothetical protein